MMDSLWLRSASWGYQYRYDCRRWQLNQYECGVEEGGGQGMWHVLWRWEAHTAICWGNLRESDHLEDQYLDGNVILKIYIKDNL
jgi:hypothetical protein